MMSPSLFYFVNADGAGHTRRAEAILKHLDVPVVVASAKPELFRQLCGRQQLTKVPQLRSTRDRKLADDVLHIPYGRDRAYLERVQSITNLCQRHQCALAVIDVCVETAMLMRLCGIPYLYMRMSGRRHDDAHLQTYRAAAGLIASYPQAFEEDWVPAWMRHKTCYTGGILSPSSVEATAPAFKQPYILVMRGKGMSQITPAAIAQAARCVTDYYWVGIGFEHPQSGPNFSVLPYVANPQAYLRHATIAIANTGNNTVLEIGRHGKPFIALPEWRFFDEQTAKAEQLAKHNLAVVLDAWPTQPTDWQQVIQSAQVLDIEAWSEILAIDGAQQAAQYVMKNYSNSTATRDAMSAGATAPLVV